MYKDYRVYLDSKTKQEMKLMNALYGIKWQDEIRAFIKNYIENVKLMEEMQQNENTERKD